MDTNIDNIIKDLDEISKEVFGDSGARFEYIKGHYENVQGDIFKLAKEIVDSSLDDDKEQIAEVFNTYFNTRGYTLDKYKAGFYHDEWKKYLDDNEGNLDNSIINSIQMDIYSLEGIKARNLFNNILDRFEIKLDSESDEYVRKDGQDMDDEFIKKFIIEGLHVFETI